jgi:hypothetical protein
MNRSLACDGVTEPVAHDVPLAYDAPLLPSGTLVLAFPDHSSRPITQSTEAPKFAVTVNVPLATATTHHAIAIEDTAVVASWRFSIVQVLPAA